MTKETIAYLSSFWTLASELADTTVEPGVSVVALGTIPPPPPPRRGFAIRPAKLSGEETAPFCAGRKSEFGVEPEPDLWNYCTSRLIQSIPDSLKLSLKLLVLHGKPPVRILE